MNDVERRLRDLGERARRDVGAPLRARPEALRRIRLRRGLASGAAALSAVAIVAGGIGVAGLRTPGREDVRPAQVATPGPEAGGCGITFGPTYLPEGFDPEPHPGSGGHDDVTAAERAGIIGHFRGPRGVYVDVLETAPPSAPVRRSQITVLGAPATLGAIHEGHSVEFRAGTCDYSLAAYGLTRGELRRFAEGLEAGSTSADGDQRPVVWPEDTRAEAETVCARSRARERTAPAIATRFAVEVLEWDSPILEPPPKPGDPWTVTPLGGDLYGGEVDAGVRIWTTEVRPRCWSVSGVSRLADRRPTGVAVEVNGRSVDVGFDPLGAAAAEIRVGYGGRWALRVWDAPAEPVVPLRLGFRPESTGSLLILLEDESGDVFSAVALSLPAGGFTAG